ncbi:hypothetical protein BpHYR1_038452 [Brachionus plicatilis]|uniref:Uncharacterized protein n=1 Tax=Brachionus plicatilis TaxID=10195 RepID=A0A3M7Q654_BRAPC|nr:hypothetical protein BpHYR1_038452 [Brachionus plicatilis]
MDPYVKSPELTASKAHTLGLAEQHTYPENKIGSYRYCEFEDCEVSHKKVQFKIKFVKKVPQNILHYIAETSQIIIIKFNLDPSLYLANF